MKYNTIKDRVSTLDCYGDVYLSEVIGRLRLIHESRSRDEFRKLLTLLGRFGKRYTPCTLNGKKFDLILDIVSSNLCTLIERLPNNYEYHIRYGVGEYAIVHNTPVEILGVKKQTVNLFRVSCKSYNNYRASGTSFEFASSFADTCATHIDNASIADELKTNSYSKSLGVCLYKYLGEGSGKGINKTFTLKCIKDIQTNMLYFSDNTVEELDNIEIVKYKTPINMILDASIYKNRGSFEWGAIAGHKKILSTIVPAWDKEVLIYDDSDLYTEFKLTLADTAHLMLKYDSLMKGVSSDTMLRVIKTILKAKVHNNSICLVDTYNEAKVLLEVLNLDHNSEVVETILKKAFIENDEGVISASSNEQPKYSDKEAWGKTKLDISLALIRVITGAVERSSNEYGVDYMLQNIITKVREEIRVWRLK